MHAVPRSAVTLPAAACLAVLALAACGTPLLPDQQQTRTYTVPLVRVLVVDGHAGHVNVTGSDRSGVSVTERISYTGQPPSTTHRESGGTLTVSYTCPSEVDCGVDYDIQVPRGLEVRASTQAGAIRLSSVAGQVKASTEAGSITGDSLAGDSAELSTHIGSIDAAFVSVPAMIRATTTTGTITIRVPVTGSRYAVITATGIGRTSVHVPKDSSAPHVIIARTDVGSVSIGPA